MPNNPYLDDLNAQAYRNFRELSIEQERRLLEIYQNAAQSLLRDYEKSSGDSISRRALKNYIDQLNAQIRSLIEDLARKAAEIPTGVQQEFLEKALDGMSINVDLTKMLGAVPDDVLRNLLSGSIYEDGRGLSDRIWGYGVQAGNDIQKLIAEAMAQGMDSRQIAQLLEAYTDPTQRKLWNKVWQSTDGKIHKLMSKKADYNAFRLARTTLNHAFQLSTKQSSKRNPFVDGLKWVKSGDHAARMHGRTDICDEWDGRIFTIENCPFDHPNGLCHTEPQVLRSYSQIANELQAWVDGEPNELLDSWFAEYGEEFLNS